MPRYLELLAQLAGADADLAADLVQRWETRARLAAVGQQVAQELGVNTVDDHGLVAKMRLIASIH